MMKDAEKLAVAVYEVHRFLQRAAAIQACGSRSVGTGAFYTAGQKVTGAARRSSLDLTRALAELRKPL